ncbi:MAG: prepilin peptidase [Paracoccaceae bacterium]|nr:prepilin peptidase [Paracoccaceae bacterium]
MTSLEWAALWLLVPAVPVALWIAWSDLKYMKIPNKAVLVMLGVFLVFGLVALPLDEYLWRLVNFLVILAIGFVLNALRLVGGGDAKYAAAIAPFFAVSDLRGVMLLFAVMLLAAVLMHRIARRLAFVRNLAPDWESWKSGKAFPMGLALSGTLLFYLALRVAAP